MSQSREGLTFLGTPATAPGPLGPQMLRSLLDIRKDPLTYLYRTWRRYGDIVQFPIPRPPSYLINEPEAVRRVLVTNARNYDKNTIQYRSLSLLTGNGLLVASTEDWRRQRPLVQPAFHHETLQSTTEHVNRAVERLVGEWRRLAAGQVIDMDAAMMHLALEVVGHALFGMDLSQDASALTRATLEGLDVVVARARVPITPPAWVPTPGNRRMAAALGQLDRAVLHMLASRRGRPAEGSSDMLDLLINARDDRGVGLTRREIRDQIVTFIVAGHETVASALTWTWALLARSPQVQDLLADEAAVVLGDRHAGFDDYARLPFARAVIDEAMRLYPPAWLITRSTNEPDVLGGADIPAGALLIMSPWLLHRHPQAWSDPWAFDPERFVESETRRVDRSAFIPFGAGPRQCIGRDFAYVEAVLTLASLAKGFAVSYPGGSMPKADASVTMRPTGGLHLRVFSR